MITITIGKADATTVDRVTLTSGMVKAVCVAFQFSDDWEGMNKVAVFSNGSTTIDVSIDEVDRCYIPHEVLAVPGKDVTCGVYGSQGTGDALNVLPTVKCSLGKVVEGVDPTGDESVPPTPNFMDALGNIDEALDVILDIQANLTGIVDVELPGEIDPPEPLE